MTALSAAMMLVLTGDGLVVREAMRSRRDPVFSQGGAFLGAAPTSSSTAPPLVVTVARTTTTAGRPVATTTTTTTTATSSPTRFAARAPAAPGTRPLHLRRRGHGERSIVGSRTFEPQLTVVVHGATGLTADQVVLDYTFSAQHEEREIATYGADGVSLATEGGSVTFGLFTEASEVAYDLPMTQIPAPLVPGTAVGDEHRPCAGRERRPGRRLGRSGGRPRDAVHRRGAGGGLGGAVLTAKPSRAAR